MSDSILRRQFRQVDKHRLALVKATQELKSTINQQAREQGLLVNPRVESVRARLGV